MLGFGEAVNNSCHASHPYNFDDQIKQSKYCLSIKLNLPTVIVVATANAESGDVTVTSAFTRDQHRDSVAAARWAPGDNKMIEEELR